jgi:hypothetical protein
VANLDRRGFLGGFLGMLGVGATKPNLVTQHHPFLITAHLNRNHDWFPNDFNNFSLPTQISKSGYFKGSCCMPYVPPKLPPYKVFPKNDIERYTNSEDTSIVSGSGVSIFVDPSGIIGEV